MKLDTLLEVRLLVRQLDQLIGDAIATAENSRWESEKRMIARGDLPSGHLAAGIKRKSMDLTRQLAKMRRGD